MDKYKKWIHKQYNKVISSIAFYPVIIAILFLILSVLMLELDFSALGKSIKSQFSWISLKDASTARTILATIAGGVISLTVFSFSMVMILLNQAASQLSNRMLDSMIGNRFQQLILGFYIGTIVYALFLLSTIRDITSGIYVPALSIYLLLLLTVVDIFLFLYFLHYVTQSVKYETIIKRIYKQTLSTMKEICKEKESASIEQSEFLPQVIFMNDSDYFQGFNKLRLVAFAELHEGFVCFLHPVGTYLIKGSPLLQFFSSKQLSEKEKETLLHTIDFYTGQPINVNPYYGYHQLAEVAIKAMSPGINDPETAVLSLHVLTDLFAYRLTHFIPTAYTDSNDVARIQTEEWNFQRLFAECFFPVWDYGKNDRYIQQALLKMIGQLSQLDRNGSQGLLFTKFLEKINEEIAKKETFLV